MVKNVVTNLMRAIPYVVQSLVIVTTTQNVTVEIGTQYCAFGRVFNGCWLVRVYNGRWLDRRDNGHINNHSPPVNIIFNKIEKYTDLAEAARPPLTQKQVVDLVYNIFKKYGLFLAYLLHWDALNSIQKTWIQFKVDFQTVVCKLYRKGALYVHQMHANLVSEIITGLQDVFQPSKSITTSPLTDIFSNIPFLTATDYTSETPPATPVHFCTVTYPTLNLIKLVTTF